ncbi:MAG: hypothetical protein M3019_04100 [Candidatus Dormibacteraeota bacterium]|nr:hypothetical protein [Candidatus Dormibacteraeota bacterium]
MGPPVDPPAQPPAPPGAPGPLGTPGARGFPVAPGGPPPSRWTWQRLVVIAGAVVVVGLVVAAVVLATRKPAPSPTPQAIVTPSASASASPSPSDTPTPSPTPPATAPPTPKPTATPTPQNTPTEQAGLLFPANGSGSGSECGANGTYSGCPVTSHLIYAANQWRAHNVSAPQPLCRCPSTYSSPFAQQNDTLLPPGYQGNPDHAAVQVSLTLSSGTENMVVLFVRQGGTWLADDTYCGSRMNTLSSGAPTTC